MNNDGGTTTRADYRGVVLLLLAAIFWSLNGAMIQLIHDQGRGPHGVTIAFYRSLFAGLFLLPLARGKWRTLRSSNPTQSLWPIRSMALIGVVLFTLMTSSFVIANTKTEAANAIILQYTSTFWVFGLSSWLLGEKPRTDDLWFVGLAMLGIIVIFTGKASTDFVGLAIALASGLFFALLTITIRRLRDSDSAAVTVLNNLGSAVLLFPVAAMFADLTLSPMAWILVITMGVVQFGVPYYLYTLGLARVRAYRAALITMVEPVLVPIWTYMAVGQTVPARTLIGGTVILFALVLFVWRSRTGNTGPG